MNKFTKIGDWLSFRQKLKGNLGFVPTMGALHAGHISLVEQSRRENDFTLVSIFLNPTQFNDKKDLQNYPSDLNKDCRLLEQVGCDFLITPNYTQLYPDNYNYQVYEQELSPFLCGQSRPGHFTGVLTVVMKLLNIARANKAYFGEKDYQQYLLIKNMVEAFFMNTEIIACKTQREHDGLALSSRNQLLSQQQRARAPALYRALKSNNSLDEMRSALEIQNFKIDYLYEKWGRRFAAAYLGDVRLIDNIDINEVTK
ncbi:MAG: pantoate--beta-alanine ligase [Bdellovibrionales bacterium]|nr:pantoate--beta-alanine ligase [Bdellovibrionales bacterium]